MDRKKDCIIKGFETSNIKWGCVIIRGVKEEYKDENNLRVRIMKDNCPLRSDHLPFNNYKND